MNRESAFREIYKNNLWHGAESASGPGSDLAATEVIRRELPVLLKRLGVKTLLDAPCGDFNWMRTLDYQFKMYVGMDIVPELVAKNKRLYEFDNRIFLLGDITTGCIPTVDLIFCRDCLAHLPIKDILLIIEQFRKSGSTYLMATTFPNVTENSDIATWVPDKLPRSEFKPGDYRAINLCLPPFNFPNPIYILDEQHHEHKTLGVWKLC